MSNEHFNELTPAEAERLAILIEDCSEVIHDATKILRHGYQSYNPDANSSVSNRKRLGVEIGQLSATIHIMGLRGDFNSTDVSNGNNERMRMWGGKYMHHQN